MRKRVIVSNAYESNNWYFEVTKRAMDIMISIFAIVLFSPIFLGVAIAIKLNDGGPVLFKQERSGKNDISFVIYKFRSMKLVQNDRSENKYNWENGVPNDFVFKEVTEENSDITAVGAFIRKYSLDELPQFFNVLLGNMSIVGPRPEITAITNCYSLSQKQRLAVKPGITGWAQVNGRSNINNGEKINLDLEYIGNKSIVLDVLIIFKTFGLVFTGKGSV